MAAKPRQIISQELQVVPDSGVTSESILIARNPKAAGLGIYVSTDGGATFQVMIPAPNKDTRKGSVLTIDDKGNAVWALPPAVRLPVSPSGLQYISFQLVGDLSVGATFGYFKVPAGRTAVLYELTMSMQDVADANVSVDLVTGGGVFQGRTAVIGTGGVTSTTTFESPLTLSSRSVWRMKVTGCGTSAPGQNLCVLAGIEFKS